MNAKNLVEQLQKIADKHGVNLEDLEVNYRVDFNSDVEEVNWITEDLYDPETNSVLKSVTLFCDDSGLEDDEE
jgi:hypothetical protein